jgi:hypothetical protein
MEVKFELYPYTYLYKTPYLPLIKITLEIVYLNNRNMNITPRG